MEKTILVLLKRKVVFFFCSLTLHGIWCECFYFFFLFLALHFFSPFFLSSHVLLLSSAFLKKLNYLFFPVFRCQLPSFPLHARVFCNHASNFFFLFFVLLRCLRNRRSVFLFFSCCIFSCFFLLALCDACVPAAHYFVCSSSSHLCPVFYFFFSHANSNRRRLSVKHTVGRLQLIISKKEKETVPFSFIYFRDEK